VNQVIGLREKSPATWANSKIPARIERMPRTGHPTKTKLIDTTAALLKTMPRSEISTDLILNTSGISKGSLYHHFEDLDELIETAMLVRYTDWVDSSIDLIMEIIARSKTPADIYKNLTELTKLTQDPNRRSERIYRAEILGIADGSPRFAQRLAEEQQRLTNALVDIIRDTQESGYFRKELDPHAIAVLIQAYTLGKVIDDYSVTPVNPDAWNELINTIIRKVFIGLE
jgi:AcrR family transcriptional regulator